MSFNECEQVKFKITETITWGVEKGKYSGYSIPAVINDSETKSKIESLVKKHDVKKNPLYDSKNSLYDSSTLYLK